MCFTTDPLSAARVLGSLSLACILAPEYPHPKGILPVRDELPIQLLWMIKDCLTLGTWGADQKAEVDFIAAKQRQLLGATRI